MERHFSMKRKKRLFPKILTAFFLTVVCIFSFIFLKHEKNIPEEVKAPVVSIPQRLKEASVTKLKFIYKCGHEKNETKRTADELIGKTREEIENLKPEWDISSFSEKEISAEISLPTDCPNHFVIRLIGNKVYVFRTNDENIIYKKREVNINDLSREDVKTLTEGIRADSELELLEIMESFS